MPVLAVRWGGKHKKAGKREKGRKEPRTISPHTSPRRRKEKGKEEQKGREKESRFSVDFSCIRDGKGGGGVGGGRRKKKKKKKKKKEGKEGLSCPCPAYRPCLRKKEGEEG